MGGIFSKSNKAQKAKDPKWQGIGPNTPLPSSSASPRDGYSHTTRSHTLTTIDSTTHSQRTTKTTTKKSGPQRSRFMLLLKLDPKGGGNNRQLAKSLISLPSDFRHTGHIGAGEVRSGQIDTEKIKNQMAEVAATLKLDMNMPLPMLKTIPIQPENNDTGSSEPEPSDRYAVRSGPIAAH